MKRLNKPQRWRPKNASFKILIVCTPFLFRMAPSTHGFMQLQRLHRHKQVQPHVQYPKNHRIHSSHSTTPLFVASPVIATNNHTSSYESSTRPYRRAETDLPISVPSFPSQETSKRFNRALLALGSTLSLTYDEATHFLLSHPQLYEYDNQQAPLHTKLLYFQSDIGISKKRLKQMILTHPSLTASAIIEMEDLKTSIELLQHELNLSAEEVWNLATQSFPQVRSYPRAYLRKTLNFYRLELGMNQEELKSIILRQPKVLQHSHALLLEAIEGLQSTFQYAPFSAEELKKIMLKFPTFLTYDTHKNFVPTLEYLLTSEIGESLGGLTKNKISTDFAMTSEERQQIIQDRVKTLLIQFPNIVGFSIKDNLKPTVRFFLKKGKNYGDGIGCSMEQLGKILWRHPEILGFSLANNLMPKVKYLQTKLELPLRAFSKPVIEEEVEEENISHLITRNPNFLSYSLQSNLEPKICYFEQYLGFQPHELRTFFVTRPQTLSLSLNNNIIPKVEYYLSKEGGDLTRDELKQFLLQKPGQLNFSLEGRIRLRVDILKKNGIHLRDAPVTIVSRSDGSFEKW